MNDLTVLREKNPAVAESIEAWLRKYQRAYKFADVADQATFYEGMVEMGRHVATNTAGASLEVKVSTEGVSSVEVSATPKSSSPSS